MNIAPLLNVLLKTDCAITVSALSQVLGRPHQSVNKGLSELRNSGCKLESHPHYGVKLTHSGLGVWADYLRWKLGPARLIEVYKQTTSTQDVVRRMINTAGSAGDGAIGVTDEQSSGRGRLGRTWIAPPGTCAIISYAKLGNTSVDHLMLAAAVAIARTIEKVAAPTPGTPGSLDVKIKWPNDILVGQKKIAGILVERIATSNPRATPAAIIGVGINVHLLPEHVPPDTTQRDELLAGITSLAQCARHIDRLTVLSCAVTEMDRALNNESPHTLVEQWHKRNTLLTRRTTLQTNGQTIHGHVLDIDPHDGLIVRTDAGNIIHLHSATTTIVK